ncbi:hypothetical protein GALMADRAFT_80032, partial [Galerina marginata CBS 339.88]
SFKKKALFTIYGGLLCLLVNITLAGNQIEGLFMWVVHRDVPGGTEAYLDATTSAWWNVFGTAAIITADIMGNALLLYRCYVLVSKWIIILPALLFLASSVLAIMTTIESGLPNANIFNGLSQDLGVAWVSLSVSFNVLVTSIICGRIFISYLALKRIGLATNARQRWGAIAILIESSLPFSVFGIIFATIFNLPVTNPNSQLVSSMADTWGGIVGISPQLIILRVAMGNAWTKNNVSSRAIELQSTNFKKNLRVGSTTKVMEDSTTSVMVDQGHTKDEELTRSPDDIEYLAVSAAV